MSSKLFKQLTAKRAQVTKVEGKLTEANNALSHVQEQFKSTFVNHKETAEVSDLHDINRRLLHQIIYQYVFRYDKQFCNFLLFTFNSICSKYTMRDFSPQKCSSLELDLAKVTAERDKELCDLLTIQQQKAALEDKLKTLSQKHQKVSIANHLTLMFIIAMHSPLEWVLCLKQFYTGRYLLLD